MAISGEAVARAAIGAGFNATPITARTPAVLMVAIAWAESDWRPEIRNHVGAGHFGLWQISALHFPNRDASKVNWQDPATNAKYAKKVFDAQGYNAWTAYRNPKMMAAIPKAIKAVQAATIDNAPAPDIPSPGDLLNPLDSLGALATDVGRAGQWLGNPANWLRIVYVIVGGALVIGALVVVAKPVVDPVLNAVPAGRIANVIKGK